MKEKGLCVNCGHDGACMFDRQFPILYCEEFYVGSNKKKFKKKLVKKGKKYKQ